MFVIITEPNLFFYEKHIIYRGGYTCNRMVTGMDSLRCLWHNTHFTGYRSYLIDTGRYQAGVENSGEDIYCGEYITRNRKGW